ncbi:hypothetical protein DAPPUDRAFT_118824 [Daphnia pulex]|uniref:NACHT domain-containing protein n=1 Tax=Daphnia pulex TaxID=6669 RepID=E9HWR1_DAPPU|nr:hypothetical protein DAPPUDRAFT_118824 [Daphnia pulex]|eukprot:EFX63822.1 hypothetical protein DAPPUDRAFT_118824 [Daphnia pulex]
MAENMEQTNDNPTALETDGAKSSRGYTTPSSTDSRGNKKARDGSHGLKFESKLLTLFSIRGLSAGYKFELGKENEDLGGKFDDVIFRYEVPDETPAGKHWRYHYLQAKHKENENDGKITANNLLDPNPNGPFSLKKYFLSYCKMRERGDDVRDCIVCTNWDVNNGQFKKIQLEEVKEQHDILKFAPGEKTVRSYKLKIDQNLRKETIKLLGVSDIEAMGMAVTSLPDTSEVQFRDKETTNSKEEEMLTIDLVTEKVVDSKTKKFRPDFINDENLSVVANKFRQKIVEVIDDFYSKLVFVVNMPNETQFKKISDKCTIQTTRIFDEISDAFEKKPVNFWLTSEEAKKILLAGVTDVSLQYQKQIEEEVRFNENAIKVMEKKLRHVLDAPGREKVERIATPSPQHTAVKVISAVQILMRELKQEGNYLAVSASRLQNEEEMEKWKNILNLQKAGIKDEINYTDLSKDCQEAILTKMVWFQGKDVTVRDLVGDQPEKVFDFTLIKDLLFEKKDIKLKIPSSDTSRFEESLYINRRVKIRKFDNNFEDELAKRLGVTSAELRKECRISLPDGHIEWLVEGERQKEIWGKMKNCADKTTPSGIIAEDNQLISFEMERRSIVIISGVAGTGKSTLLSHFYKEIKTKKPDYWVIKMNLVDRCEAIVKWYDGKPTNAADFFVNYLSETGNNDSSFTNSLLRYRLEKGDRIVIMLDGFDEIDARCQNSAIQLMKAISKNKSIQLYVTTRPHSVDDLQNELFQFSYTLEIFDMNDQIRYLTQYWETKLDTEEDIQDKSIIRKFAASLADRVSQTLRDQERSFIGIPLQCRILAECFQQELQTIIKRNSCKDGSVQTDFENQLFENVNFDLNSLYKLLMKTKRRVFREEKVKAPVPNQITDYAIDFLIEKIESHLTKLAIETLVTDKKSADILWPPQLSYHQLKTDKMQEENMITEFGVKFGLIMYKDEAIKTQFLHRTFAEYLLAKYLYRGIAVNHCENNYLLDNEQVRDLIISKILGERNFDGVRIFFDSMLKKTLNSTAWHVISEGKKILPSQLQNFTNDLALHIEKPQDTYNTYDYCPNLLGNTVYERNENLFDFLCDCLDIVLDKNGVRQDVGSVYIGNLSEYIWNTEETKKVVKILLDLIEQNRMVFMNEVMSPGKITFRKGDRMFELLHFFIFNEHYGSLFDQFFRLLSSCLDDCAFTNLLEYTLRKRDANNNNWAYPLNSGIEKTLIILRDLGRHKVIEGLSHLTLVWDKKLFETFYHPYQPKEEENPSDLQLLLKNRDSSRMTLLHRAAFYGDAQTVDDILETIRKSISSATNHLVELVVKDIMLARNDECFTPFYVAAASGHKEICVQILFFLKEILGTDQIKKCLIADGGFLHRAMWVAIRFKNDSMFKVILEGVNQALGQDNLFVLLKSSDTERDRSVPKYDKVLIKMISKFLLQNGSENGYEGLNNLILHPDPYVDSRADIYNTLEEVEDETLQGMLTVKGVENWTQRFLDFDISLGYRFLSIHLLARFTRNQRSQFVDAITSPHTPITPSYPVKISYWAKWFVGDEYIHDFMDLNCLEKLQKIIAENQDNTTTDIQKLLFSDSGKDITRALLCRNRKIVSVMFKHLSEMEKLQITRDIKRNGPKIIDEMSHYLRTSENAIRREQIFRY